MKPAVSAAGFQTKNEEAIVLLNLTVCGVPAKVKVLSAPDANKLEFEARNHKGVKADWLDRKMRNNGREFHRVREQVIEELELESRHVTNEPVIKIAK